MSNLADLVWPLQTWWTGKLTLFHTKRFSARYLGPHANPNRAAPRPPPGAAPTLAAGRGVVTESTAAVSPDVLSEKGVNFLFDLGKKERYRKL
jgi:hypothetical protein